MAVTDFTEQGTLRKEATPPGLVRNFGAACGLGLVGVALFYEAELGLNFALWSALLLVCVLGFARYFPRNRQAAGLLVAALGAGALLLWRDAPVLRMLAVLAWGSAICLAAFAARGVSLAELPLTRCASAALLYVIHFVVNGVTGALAIINAALGVSRQRGGVSVAVARGLLMLVPLLIFYLILFSAADAVYSNYLTSMLNLDWETLFICGFIFTFCFVLSFGIFLNNIAGLELSDLVQSPRPREVSAVEANTVLIGLNVLFLSFVLLQLRVLFGGETYIQQVPDLSYAVYAKRGFYQLIVAGGVIVPLLLALDWLCEENRGKGRELFVGASCALLAQVGVILVSAMHRLFLYIDAYGLSTQRIYGVAALAWIAGLLVLCGVLLLTRRRQRYAGAAWCWSLAIVLGLHLFSPDALAIRVNLERAAAGAEFDLRYALTLEAESVPVAVERLNVLPPGQQRDYLFAWFKRLEPGKPLDPRSWNYGVWKAREALLGAMASYMEFEIEGD